QLAQPRPSGRQAIVLNVNVQSRQLDCVNAAVRSVLNYPRLPVRQPLVEAEALGTEELLAHLGQHAPARVADGHFDECGQPRGHAAAPLPSSRFRSPSQAEAPRATE